MKTSFTFISVVFFLLSFIPVKSYCQISIKGQVQEEYGNALPYANVILLTSKDSSLVQGVVVKEGGEFQIDNVHPGSYLLDFSMVGYFPHYTSLQASNTNLQIGLVKLKEDNKQLDEVIVQSQKMLYEQKIDRLVMNVSGSPILTGGTALEVLKRAPGVFVDDANGNITMKGKAGVLVLINGKPTNASLEVVLNRLRGMSSSNIEHIEMLQSPPAEYDAEGNAGAINIILKKNIDQGLNGTVGLSLTYGRFISENGHFDLNWRKGQLNLYGNGSILNGMGHDKYLEHDRSFVLDNINYFSSNIQLIHHNPHVMEIFN